MKTNLIKKLALVLALILAISSLGGCSKSEQGGNASAGGKSVKTEVGHQGGDVVLGVNTNPTEFFTPYKQGTLNSYGWTIFEPLAYDVYDGTYEKCLAESWELDQDNYTLTIHLRQGITFSNGDPFNADDVVFTLTCREEYGTYGLIGNPVSVEKVDDYTVKVTWDSFSLNFEYWILPQYMYSKETFEEKGLDWMLTNMVGTGPYVMDEYIPDVHLKVVRNENYWGETIPGPDSFEWVVISDNTAMLASFLNNEIGQMGNVTDPTMLDQLAKANYQALNTPVNMEMQYWAVPVMLDPEDPLMNKEVRQAIYLYGVDWNAMGKTVAGEGAYHTDAVGKKNMPYYNESLEVSQYDVEKAKQMLADAGYADGFSTTIYALSNMAGEAAFLQDALKALNITAEVETVDYTQINGEYITGNAVKSGIVFSVMAYNMYTTNQDDRFVKFFSPVGTLKGVTAFTDEQVELWNKASQSKSLDEQSENLRNFVKSYVGDEAMLWPMYDNGGKDFSQAWYHLENKAYCTMAGRNPHYIWCDEH